MTLKLREQAAVPTYRMLVRASDLSPTQRSASTTTYDTEVLAGILALYELYG
jgi:hypothetical protein